MAEMLPARFPLSTTLAAGTRVRLTAAEALRRPRYLWRMLFHGRLRVLPPLRVRSDVLAQDAARLGYSDGTCVEVLEVHRETASPAADRAYACRWAEFYELSAPSPLARMAGGQIYWGILDLWATADGRWGVAKEWYEYLGLMADVVSDSSAIPRRPLPFLDPGRPDSIDMARHILDQLFAYFCAAGASAVVVPGNRVRLRVRYEDRPIDVETEFDVGGRWRVVVTAVPWRADARS